MNYGTWKVFSDNVNRSLALALVIGLAVQSGCGTANSSQTKITNRRADASSQWSDDLFNFAVENLNHLEDNDCGEMLRTTQRRLGDLQKPGAAAQPADALLASWPEPDMLRQVVSRLNQWVDTLEKPAESKPDPMLAALPAELARLPMIENLGQAHFTSYDGYMLMEAVWLRDAARSKWTGGGSADELQLARSLFDWTVRNIQADYDDSNREPQVPWETLFLGHGTAWERAWTFILLLRQRGIDAAVLALPAADSSPAAPGSAVLKPWCVGVLIGDKEKELYLFDPELGLPIPGPQGVGLDKSGRLDVEPGTLDQIVANPKLLDRLRQGTDSPYWAQKADLKRAVALLEASPLYLSPRAHRIESRLTGDNKLVLSAQPSPQAARVKAAGIGEVRLWELPYTTLQRRRALGPEAIVRRLLAYVPFMSGQGAPLYKARIMHLKGRLFDEKEAIAYYQKARPRTQSVLEEAPKFAKIYYDSVSHQIKPDGKLTPAEDRQLLQVAAWQAQQLVGALIEGKLDASYWLGLIEYDLGDYTAAMDYFNVRTLKLSPNGFWAKGAHYNVARTLEVTGQRRKAITIYETSILLRNDKGCLVRARWLKEIDGVKEKQSEETKENEEKITAEEKVEKKPADKKPEEKKPATKENR